MGWFSGKDEPEPAPAKALGQGYTMADRPLRCPHCAGEQFTGQIAAYVGVQRYRLASGSMMCSRN